MSRSWTLNRRHLQASPRRVKKVAPGTASDVERPEDTPEDLLTLLINCTGLSQTLKRGAQPFRTAPLLRSANRFDSWNLDHLQFDYSSSTVQT